MQEGQLEGQWRTLKEIGMPTAVAEELLVEMPTVPGAHQLHPDRRPL